MASHWPHLLDGRDVLENNAHGNYLRNLFELTSFVATTGVLITGLLAFSYGKSQVKEARDIRLATLYATLEARWSSVEMLKSKTLFGNVFALHSVESRLSRRVNRCGDAARPYFEGAGASFFGRTTDHSLSRGMVISDNHMTKLHHSG